MTVLTKAKSRLADALEAGPVGRVRRIAVGFAREFLEDDLMGLSGELAYRWLLSIFPLAIMIAAISGIAAQGLGVEDPSGRLLDAAGSSLPPEAAATLRPQLERILQQQDGALLSLGLLLSIWAAASGMKAIIKGLNRAYDVVETRPFWRQNVVALALTVLLGAAVVLSFIALVAGQVAAQDVAAALGLQEATAWVFEVAPYPLAILALGAASWFLYWSAPARRPAKRWALPGVILFVPGWIIATFLFSLYVANFGSYDDTYGALGGVIVLLLWFYLTALILLAGGEINAVLEREFGGRRRGVDGSGTRDTAARSRHETASAGEPLARPGSDADG